MRLLYFLKSLPLSAARAGPAAGGVQPAAGAGAQREEPAGAV